MASRSSSSHFRSKALANFSLITPKALANFSLITPKALANFSLITPKALANFSLITPKALANFSPGLERSDNPGSGIKRNFNPERVRQLPNPFRVQ
jgi:hypothetical protein